MYFHETWDAETTSLTECLVDDLSTLRALSESADAGALAPNDSGKLDHAEWLGHRAALQDRARQPATV